MILFGTIVGAYDSGERPLWPSRASCFAASIGVVLALYVFMADSLGIVFGDGNATQLRELLPQWFNWPLFIATLIEVGYDGGVAIEHEDLVFWNDRYDEGLVRGWQTLDPLINPRSGR